MSVRIGHVRSFWCVKFHVRLISMADSMQDYFKDDTLALIGYGSQGHGQGLNLRDNGLNVIIGVRKNGASWKEAEQDGWIPGKNLFEVDEAISRGTIIMNLLSDAAQSETWPAIKPQLTKGKVRTY
jgi:ketol-acid reductoisomerase